MGWDGDKKIMFISIQLPTDPTKCAHRDLLTALDCIINDDKLRVMVAY